MPFLSRPRHFSLSISYSPLSPHFAHMIGRYAYGKRFDYFDYALKLMIRCWKQEHIIIIIFIGHFAFTSARILSFMAFNGRLRHSSHINLLRPGSCFSLHIDKALLIDIVTLWLYTFWFRFCSHLPTHASAFHFAAALSIFSPAAWKCNTLSLPRQCLPRDRQ